MKNEKSDFMLTPLYNFRTAKMRKKLQVEVDKLLEAGRQERRLFAARR